MSWCWRLPTAKGVKAAAGPETDQEHTLHAFWIREARIPNKLMCIFAFSKTDRIVNVSQNLEILFWTQCGIVKRMQHLSSGLVTIVTCSLLLSGWVQNCHGFKCRFHLVLLGSLYVISNYFKLFSWNFNSFYMYIPNLYVFCFFYTKSKMHVYLLMGQNEYQGSRRRGVPLWAEHRSWFVLMPP